MIDEEVFVEHEGTHLHGSGGTITPITPTGPRNPTPSTPTGPRNPTPSTPTGPTEPTPTPTPQTTPQTLSSGSAVGSDLACHIIATDFTLFELHNINKASGAYS